MQTVLVPVFIFVSLLLACAGCSDGRPERVPVAGQVRIDGEPLSKGYVRFVPEGARPSGGEIGPNGRFNLRCYDGSDGAVPGTHRVEVTAREILSATSVRWLAPKKYSSYATSGLIEEITGPTDSVILELSWHGGEPFVETFDTE